MSQWIWRVGEFEIYHNMILHQRRQQYGYMEPVVWKLYAPEPVVRFRKTVTTEGGIFTVTACGDSSTTVIDEESSHLQGAHYTGVKKYGGRSEIELQRGKYTIEIRVSNSETFPCIYVDGVIRSDETWIADDMSNDWTPVGTYESLCDVNKTPETFSFAYEPVDYVRKEKIAGGVLFDFGRETFARTKIYGLSGHRVRVQFGESYEEALDAEHSIIHFERSPENGVLQFIPYAFRYIFISDEDARIEAEYEYLPLEHKGAFRCNDEVVNRVWDVAAYTFHLCSREFFLDGIKRDRWVWSADAYQSLFVSRYLFYDKDIEKRTLIALGGKEPFKAHINTIMDYSFFWIISLYEYYITYGDKEFIRQIAPQMDRVIHFCLERTDADGFMREKPGDWVFIDWAPMDKTGALCGEQILYARALECYAAIGAVIGRDTKEFAEKAAVLQRRVMDKFYDSKKKVFIDSYESGKRNITRHSNILAYLFLPCSERQKKDIYENVILNDDVPQITTPYFKFYENQVHCMAGNPEILEEAIRDYYGSMLSTGATTLYEEYDPDMSGTEHYAMYGDPYGKSLCHAWSASPIYLLGCYRLGVRNTGIAYETFDVRPQLGGLREFKGQVPVPGGVVSVEADEKGVRVKVDIEGGTLYIGNAKYTLQKGVEKYVQCGLSVGRMEV